MNLSYIKHILKGHLGNTVSDDAIASIARTMYGAYMDIQLGRPRRPDICPFDYACELRDVRGICRHPEHSSYCVKR